ncbi:MAG: UDP-3-O-acyl-N-acetylglucosamine deacetylase, partial [Candidatus Calescibacterium sp.]|nr:UDP-3-O-acyl-N-acetylglucosamine deacetylase [Candidatus Calescibacterium sp.]
MSPHRIINTVGSTDIETVKTIEHLLCSLFINKIDNVLVETIGPEIPILD